MCALVPSTQSILLLLLMRFLEKLIIINIHSQGATYIPTLLTLNKFGLTGVKRRSLRRSNDGSHTRLAGET